MLSKGGPDTNRLHLAYHEAGHAAVAHALGWRIVQVTLGEHGGYCASRPALWVRSRPMHGPELERDRRRLAARTARANAIITLAGIAAEGIAIGAIHPQAAPEREEAAAIARARTDHHHRYVERSWRHAHRILQENWPAVEALAAALLRDGQMDGARARAIIRAALEADAGHS